MSSIVTTKEYSVNSYDVDSLYEVGPHIILRYMQDVAMEQSERAGVGLEYLNQKGLSWIVTRYSVDVSEIPKYKDKLKVTTRPLGFNKLFAYREFLIEDAQHKPLIKSLSQWMLINNSTHRLCKIEEDFYRAYCVERSSRHSVEFDKLVLPGEHSTAKKYRALYTDVDFNGHVNNTRYIAWAMDSVPKEIHQDYKIVNFDIVFKKEVLYGDIVYINTDVEFKTGSCRSAHVIESKGGKTICVVNIVWKSRK